MSGQRHAPVTLLRKIKHIPIEYEAGWNSEFVWIFWRREKNPLSPPGLEFRSRPAPEGLWMPLQFTFPAFSCMTIDIYISKN